jgi:hypothetical protein
LFTISLEDQINAKLQGVATQINAVTAQLASEAVANLAQATFWKAKELAENKLNTTAELYKDALQFEVVAPGVYSVSLGEEAAHLEEGYCVLHNPGWEDKRQPKVFSLNGWTPITKIKEGDLVLNQFGHFTQVLKVHSREFIPRTIIEGAKAGRRQFGTFGNRDVFSYSCTDCEWAEDLPRIKAPRLCPVCVRPGYVEISATDKSTVLKVTDDHEIMTKRGWIRAIDLDKTDEVAWCSGKLCERCREPSRERYCSRSCSATTNNNRNVKNGTHPAQQDRASYRARYLTNLKLARTQNSLVAHFIKELKWEGKLEQEFPVKCIRTTGKKTCFWLDMYFPDLKLGIEMDGVAFHRPEQDAERDRLIKEQHGIDILRITNVEWKKSRPDCLDRARRLLGNHSGLFAKMIDFRPIAILNKKKPGNGFSLTHRWDITVGQGESFVCQGIVIHNSKFDMKPGLLAKNAKRSKAGFLYKVIPMQQNASGSAKKGTTSGNMLQDLKMLRGGFGDKGLTKGPDGQVMLGKVWSAAPDGMGSWDLKPGQSGVEGQHARFAKQPDKNLAGVTKYQYGTPTRSGGMKYSSSFVTWRVVSNNPKYANKFVHPGFDGVRIFDTLQTWAMNELEKIVDEIFSQLK